MQLQSQSTQSQKIFQSFTVVPDTVWEHKIATSAIPSNLLTLKYPKVNGYVLGIVYFAHEYSYLQFFIFLRWEKFSS